MHIQWYMFPVTGFFFLFCSSLPKGQVKHLECCWHCLLLVKHQQHAQYCLMRARFPAPVLQPTRWRERSADSWECAKGLIYWQAVGPPLGDRMQRTVTAGAFESCFLSKKISSLGGKKWGNLLLKLPKTKKGSCVCPCWCQLALLAHFLF